MIEARMKDYSDLEKLAEVEREIAMRRKVFPGLVAKGSMSDAQSKRRIAVMEAIAEDYRTSVNQMKLPV